VEFHRSLNTFLWIRGQNQMIMIEAKFLILTHQVTWTRTVMPILSYKGGKSWLNSTTVFNLMTLVVSLGVSPEASILHPKRGYKFQTRMINSLMTRKITLIKRCNFKEKSHFLNWQWRINKGISLKINKLDLHNSADRGSIGLGTRKRVWRCKWESWWGLRLGVSLSKNFQIKKWTLLKIVNMIKLKHKIKAL
jgi:hypothetical protein